MASDENKRNARDRMIKRIKEDAGPAERAHMAREYLGKSSRGEKLTQREAEQIAQKIAERSDKE